MSFKTFLRQFAKRYQQPETKLNKYDIFIDNLTKNFSTIPNLDLLEEDGPGKILFSSLIQRFSELYSIKSLFINNYLPTALKAADEEMKAISTSKYKSQIDLTEDDIKENYYETVRLGYVAAYHKYEVFIKELLINSELVFAEINDNSVPLEKYVNKTFGFNFHNIWYSPRLHRINYICNCTKHCDSYPIKPNKPDAFKNSPEDKKLVFTEQELSDDIDFLIRHYNLLISAVLFFSSYKMLHEGVIADISELSSDPRYDELLEKKQIVDEQARQFIQTLKTE